MAPRRNPNYRKKKQAYKKKALTKPQVRQVNKMIHSQIEDKYTDDRYPYTSQSYNTGLTIPRILTNGIAQGVSVSERIGDRVMIKSLDIRFSIYHNSAGVSDPANSYRIIIFKWKLNTAVSIPSLGGILQDQPGLGATQNYGCDSPYMWVNQKNDDFAILYDKKFSLAPNSPAQNKHIRLTKYLGAINFKPTTVDGSGHLYIMVASDDAAPFAPCPVIGYISRVIYEDA